MNTNIEIKDDGAFGHLTLNGVDLSDYVTSVEYKHTGNQPAEVKIGFVADEVTISSPFCKTQVAKTILDALKKRG